MCDVLLATGEIFHEAADLDLPGHPPFLFQRAYSSTSTEIRSLGRSWRHNFEVSLNMENEDLRIYDGIEGEVFYPLSHCDGVKGPRLRRDSDTIELEFNKGIKKTFVKERSNSPTWLLSQITDENENWMKFEYFARQLLRIWDSQKREIIFEYDNRLITGVQVSHRELRQQATYVYDGAKRLVEIIDPLGASQRFEYDDHLIIRFVNKVGFSRYFSYDDRGRCVSSWYDGNIGVRYYQFDSEKRVTLLSDTNGYRALYQFTEKGVPQTIKDPLGRVTESILDREGRQVGTILPDGIVRNTAVYFADTRVLESTDIRGALTKYHFDERDNVVTIENAIGHSLHFERDSRGNTIGISAPEKADWRFEYDERGSLSRVTDPKGNWIARSDSGAFIELTDAQGRISIYQFDSLGNLLRDTDAQNRTTTYEYEGQDRPICMILPDGRRIRWNYDAAGRIVAVTDALGRTTRYEYGPFAAVRETVLPDGRRTALNLDSERNLLEIINSKKEITRLQYDNAYRIVRIAFFDGRTVGYEYDLRNRPTVRIDGRGNRTRLEYDEGTNIVRRDLPDGTTQVNEYDGVGRLIAMATEPPPNSEAQSHSSAFTYDGNNHVTSEEHDGYKVEYEYDECGNLIAVRDSLKRELHYSIGLRRWVTRVIDGDRAYELTYSPSGELTEMLLPNGMLQRFQFDLCSRLVRREVLSANRQLLAWRNFTYDAADQLIEMEDWRTGRFQYAYDLAGRLISVSRPDGVTLEAYSYDLEDNLLSSPDFAAYVIAPGNRLQRSGPIEYSYDDDGCLIGIQDGSVRTKLSYDSDNQLIRVYRNDTLIATYDYDLMGRRTRKITEDDEVEFYYHVNRLRTIISKKHGRCDIMYAPDTFVPISQSRDDRVYYYSFDQIGTPTEVWDEEGNLVAALSSRAYGSGRTLTTMADGGMSIPFHFMGQYADEETGLHYNRFRYYSPATARFITHDPMGLTKALNLYKYPTNPMNWVDPFGLMVLQINCSLEHRAFTPCEQYAAQEKLKTINAASKNRRKRTCTECRENKQKSYFEDVCGGNPPKGHQVDHVLELQLGGADSCCGNLAAISGSVNGSFGSQIKNLISKINVNDCVPKFEFAPPGCKDAKKCTGKDRDQAVVRGTKDDGKDCDKEPPLDC